VLGARNQLHAIIGGLTSNIIQFASYLVQPHCHTTLLAWPLITQAPSSSLSLSSSSTQATQLEMQKQAMHLIQPPRPRNSSRRETVAFIRCFDQSNILWGLIPFHFLSRLKPFGRRRTLLLPYCSSYDLIYFVFTATRVFLLLMISSNWLSSRSRLEE